MMSLPAFQVGDERIVRRRFPLEDGTLLARGTRLRILDIRTAQGVRAETYIYHVRVVKDDESLADLMDIANQFELAYRTLRNQTRDPLSMVE